VHERYGGQGAGLAQTAAVLRALGQGDPSAALIAAMTMFAHALQGIDPTWPDDIYQAAVAEGGCRAG
jgi:alkylation response protein AidB-like acyl-CoA dehydrogenase